MPSMPLRQLHTELRKIEKQGAVEIHERIELASWSSMKLGGTGDLLVRCTTEDGAARALMVFRSLGVPYFILGAGTNVVFSDRGLRIPLLTLGGSLSSWELDPDGVLAGGSANLTQVCRAVARAGLTGMESLFGIPGSIGGAVVMNAGAYGVEIFDLLDWVEIVVPGGRPTVLPAHVIEHRYRWTEFQDSEDLVTRVHLRLEPGKLSSVLERVREVNRRRRAKLPSQPSAGSVFKNPQGDHAGRLLEEAGCNRLRIGGARVTETHANIIVADRGATASDVVDLARVMRRRVQERFAIILEPEVLFLDEMGNRIDLGGEPGGTT